MWPPTIDEARVLPSTDQLAALCSSCRALVVRGALDPSHRGWRGTLVEASTNSIMTFYPCTRQGAAFSRQKCHGDRVAIKPSVAFYEWLASIGGPAWQLRGDIRLEHQRLASITKGRQLRVLSTSLWGGAGGSRTPLHADNIHALIFQVAGSKRFFLSTRAEIANAVGEGRLPGNVLDCGETEDYCVDGSQDTIYGLREQLPTGPTGHLAELLPGDALLLPAGLYHDVECDACPALSLTLRFDFDDDHQSKRRDDDALRRFLWRLALKKAVQDRPRGSGIGANGTTPPDDRAD